MTKSGRSDFWWLAAVVVLLIGAGIVFNLSSTYYPSERIYGDPLALMRRQFFALFVGLGFGAGAFFLKLEKYPALSRRYPYWALGVAALAVGILLTVYIPGLGKRVAGGLRWVVLGPVQFQPSEVCKLLLILYLAAVLPGRADRMGDFLRGFLPPVLVLLLCTGFVAVEPDLSTGLVVLTLGLTLFILSGAKKVHLLVIVSVLLGLGALLLEFKPYMVRRFQFINPWGDPYGNGYHLIQSFQAFVNGGLLGAGPGNSSMKIGRLPESHTDFVYAVIGEETGFLGGLALLLLFFALILGGFRLAGRLPDPSFRLLAVGLVMNITLSAWIHMSVTLGILPTSGLPLPFISYGGTDLVMKMTAAGLLLNLARRTSPPVLSIPAPPGRPAPES